MHRFYKDVAPTGAAPVFVGRYFYKDFAPTSRTLHPSITSGKPDKKSKPSNLGALYL